MMRALWLLWLLLLLVVSRLASISASPTTEQLLWVVWSSVQREHDGGMGFTDIEYICAYQYSRYKEKSLEPKAKRHRTHPQRKDRGWWNSEYYNKYHNAEEGWYEVDANKLNFRNNFRMGWPSFCFLVNTTREFDFDYDDTRKDIQGRPCGSLEPGGYKLCFTAVLVQKGR
jgi:hypothetical protein